MDLDALAGRIEAVTGKTVKWNRDRDAFIVECPRHPGVMALGNLADGLKCMSGCTTEQILPPPPDPPFINGNGPTNGTGPFEETVRAWQRRMGNLVRHVLEGDPEFKKPHLTAELALQPLLETFGPIVQRSNLPDWQPPVGLTVTEATELIEGIAQKELALFYADGDEEQAFTWEQQGMAIAANELYLKRIPIIERLAYTESTSLLVGPKHGGKTTNVRTVALSVTRGVPIWGRQTTKGHVIYVASADEVASTRMELLRMGWSGQDDQLLLAHLKPDANQAKALEALARQALRCGTVLIILDMLFDFAPIKDEMSYAGTRLAVGEIQRLADMTKAHVMATHHSPKYMLDTATAATAALGSQGIAARFSPIILCRKWTDDLFTVESTMTRDPRGLAIPQTCVTVDAQGWSQSVGEFKSWMKWKLYSRRVMEHMEAGEPGQNFTVGGIAQDLDINRPDAQNALYQMFKNGAIDRMKIGRSYKYFLKTAIPTHDPAVSVGETPDFRTVDSIGTPTLQIKPKRLWGDEADEVDENGISRGD